MKRIRVFLILLCIVLHFVSNASENCVDVSRKNDAYWSTLFEQKESEIEFIQVVNAATKSLHIGVYEIHEAAKPALFGYIYEIPAHEITTIPVPKMITKKLFFAFDFSQLSLESPQASALLLNDNSQKLIKKIIIYPIKDGKPDEDGNDIQAKPFDLSIYKKMTGDEDPILIENQTPYDLFVALYQESSKDAKRVDKTQKIDDGGFVLIERPYRKFGIDRNVYFSSDEQKLKELLPPDDKLRVKKQFINVGSGVFGTNEFKISSTVIDKTVQGPETATSQKVKRAISCKVPQKVEQTTIKKSEKIVTEAFASMQITNSDSNFALQVWLREKKEDTYCLVGKPKRISPKETIDLKYPFESKNEIRLYFRAVEKDQKLKLDQCQETCEKEMEKCKESPEKCQEEYKECKELEEKEGFTILEKNNPEQKWVIYRVDEKGHADPFCSIYVRKHRAATYDDFYKRSIFGGENKIQKEVDESLEKLRANKGACP